MKNTVATVIVPTTGDRADLLKFSVQSILRQSIKDIEVCIVGDGVANNSKIIIKQLFGRDPRVSFYDFPKHVRRGEPYRHEVIKKSSGSHIFYLCDRDLMLPTHIEMMLKFLKDYNFVSSTFINVSKNGFLNIDQHVTYYGSGVTLTPRQRDVGTLSCIGHSKDLYTSLIYGWRTTPLGRHTDNYMWEQVLSSSYCKPYSLSLPGILYFKRGDFPGDPVSTRAKELAYWSNQIAQPDGVEKIIQQALAGLLIERNQLRRLHDFND